MIVHLCVVVHAALGVPATSVPSSGTNPACCSKVWVDYMRVLNVWVRRVLVCRR